MDFHQWISNNLYVYSSIKREALCRTHVGNYGTETDIVSESEKKIVEGFQYRSNRKEPDLRGTRRYIRERQRFSMCYFLRII